MKKIALILLLLLAAMMPCKKTFASHAAGGEITYEWLADSTYRFYFSFYRDCSGIPAPDTVQLCFKSACSFNADFKVAMVRLVGQIDTAQPWCPQYKNQCDSPASYTKGFRKLVYTKVVTMPSQCFQWVMGAIVDSRNTSMNLSNGTSFYVESMMNNVGSYQGNSSPYCTTSPVPFVCVNQPSAYTTGAIDPNGDSLAYQMIMPRITPNPNDCSGIPIDITFYPTTPSYGIPYNPIQTYNTFSLNVLTGMMTFTPGLQGASTMAVRIKKYRNNVLIGYVDRDIQVQVEQCNLPTTTFGVSTPGIIQACAGQPLNFCFWAKSSPGARLKSSDNHTTSLPGSTVNYQLQGTDSVSGCVSWTPGVNNTGLHTLNVFVKDSTCNAPGMLPTYGYSLQVYVVAPAFASKDTAICPGGAVQLTTAGTGPYIWSVISGTANSLSCTNCQSPLATPAGTTTYQVLLTGATACPYNKDTVTVTMLPHILPSTTITVTPDTSVLAGTMVTFSATPTNCTNPSYQWQRNGVDLPGAKLATWSSANLVDLDIITVRMTCSDTCIIDTPSNKLRMHIGTGINSIDLHTIAVHPNPNTGEFTVSGHVGAEEITVEIVNVTGQVIYRQEKLKTASGEIKHKLNVGHVAAGNYMLRIKTADKVLTERVTIQR